MEDKIINAIFNTMAFIVLLVIMIPGALIMLLMKKLKRKDERHR
jgi:NhaP-type Na+/H+ and K+/H+ antiporter